MLNRFTREPSHSLTHDYIWNIFNKNWQEGNDIPNLWYVNTKWPVDIHIYRKLSWDFGPSDTSDNRTTMRKTTGWVGWGSNVSLHPVSASDSPPIGSVWSFVHFAGFKLLCNVTDCASVWVHFRVRYSDGIKKKKHHSVSPLKAEIYVKQ